MRSTGEVMGIDRTFGLAFAKSQIAAGDRLPRAGTVFLSLADRDKAAGVAGRAGSSSSSASRSPPPPAPPTTSRPTASPVAERVAKLAESRGRAARRRRAARGRPDRARQGRPGGQQPAGPGPAGRRRLHPRAPPALDRHPAASPPPPPAWPPPRAWPTGPATSCGSGTLQEYHGDALDEAGRRREAGRGATSWPRRCVDLTTPCRVGDAAQPGDDRVGHGRPRRRAGAPTSTCAGLGAVVVKSLLGRAVARQPAAAGARDRRPGCSTASACRAPASRPGWTTTCRRSSPPAPGSWRGSGAARSTTTARPPTLLAGAPPEVVAVEVNLSCPNLEDGARPVRPRRPGHGGGHRRRPRRCGRPLLGQAQPQHHRPGRRSRPPPRRRRRRGGHAGQHGDGHGHRPRDPPAPGSAAAGGGLSGPAIHPVAVRAVHDVHRRLPEPADRGRRRRGRRAATPSSCCWPARRRCRSARRPSPTPVRPGPRVLDGAGSLVPPPRVGGRR